MVFPPGDLYSHEPPWETDLHRDPTDLLVRLLRSLWQDRQDFYVSGNITIYYSPKQIKSWVILVMPITRQRPTRHAVIWFPSRGDRPFVTVAHGRCHCRCLRFST